MDPPIIWWAAPVFVVQRLGRCAWPGVCGGPAGYTAAVRAGGLASLLILPIYRTALRAADIRCGCDAMRASGNK